MMWWKRLTGIQQVWFAIGVIAVVCHIGWLSIGLFHILPLVFVKPFVLVEAVLGVTWWIMLAFCPSIVR
jgi:uncharacterized membrane protein YuzA (DUF378 family)